jgi:hypothetical protein
MDSTIDRPVYTHITLTVLAWALVTHVARPVVLVAYTEAVTGSVVAFV